MVSSNHPHPRKAGRLASRLRFGCVCLLLAAALLTCCACTSNDASKHTLIINGAVHLYPDPDPPSVYPGPNFLEVLGPKDKVKVQQVLYRKGYMAVKIRLNDGREGWVFSGESIELK